MIRSCLISTRGKRNRSSFLAIYLVIRFNTAAASLVSMLSDTRFGASVDETDARKNSQPRAEVLPLLLLFARVNTLYPRIRTAGIAERSLFCRRDGIEKPMGPGRGQVAFAM